MPDKWLILDVNFLGWRAHHALGQLKHDNQTTGVIFGVLRDFLFLRGALVTNRVAWCFDGPGESVRKKTYPNYKNKPTSTREAEHEQARREVLRQLKELRSLYLPAIGFANIVWQWGYEGDDMIAAVCQGILPADEAVIVSADKDLYQLLSPSITIWNPGKRAKQTTLHDFHREYGIMPDGWPDVKALAGCLSDNVSGVRGVGEVFATRYVRGELNKNSAAYKRITSKEGQEIYNRNLALVTLPHEGTNSFKPAEDVLNQKAWSEMCDELGFTTLKGEFPYERSSLWTPMKRRAE